MKKLLLFISLFFAGIPSVLGANMLDIINKYDVKFEEEVYVDDTYKIDLSSLSDEIKESFPEKDIEFEWLYKDDSVSKDKKFVQEYKTTGVKDIKLNIYDIRLDNKVLLHEKNFSVFVYDKTIPLIVSDKVSDLSLSDYVESFKPYGIKVEILGRLSKFDMELYTVLNKLDDYYNIDSTKSDYIVLWGGKDFVFDIISKLNREITLTLTGGEEERSYSLYVLSTFNINVMSSYLNNFLGNKPWIDKLLITQEQSGYKVFEKSSNISDVQNALDERQIEYIDVQFEESAFAHLNFISSFISNFSNKGYDINSIYIILIIPFILTVIAFFKHFIGLSTTGILVPLFLVILAIKLGILVTLICFGLLIIINVAISNLISRYTLLYTPKISFLITFNLIFFIIGFNLLEKYGLTNLTVTDSIYVVLFILISERLISLIVSKEFGEYKHTLFNTLIVFLFCYFLFGYQELKVLILAYPEILIILLPLNFLIGRFTGLRVTEYFRFREIIKNIEE